MIKDIKKTILMTDNIEEYKRGDLNLMKLTKTDRKKTFSFFQFPNTIRIFN